MDNPSDENGLEFQFSISEMLTYSTVRIETELFSGGTAYGTAFLYRFFVEGGFVPLMITNKHVIEGAKIGRFRFHRADANFNPIPCETESIQMDDFEAAWIPHPDPDVDLCALPLLPIDAHLRRAGKTCYFQCINSGMIPTPGQVNDFTAVEEVLMIGYPTGIWDTKNNMPIVRRGVTATHPRLDYNGTEEFIIDAACFPGSSGSPVFIYNTGGFITKEGMMVGERIFFLGVLYAGPQFTAEGEIEVVNVPTQQIPMAISRIPMNLGFVIKSKKLHDFEPLLIQQK
jgi:hypothetical protein